MVFSLVRVAAALLAISTLPDLNSQAQITDHYDRNHISKMHASFAEPVRAGWHGSCKTPAGDTDHSGGAYYQITPGQSIGSCVIGLTA